MIETPPALAQLVAPWAHLYSHWKVVSTLTVFLHVTALVVGGGLAITLDRATLRALATDDVSRGRHLQSLASAHPTVLASLALALVSGVALVAADLDTFLSSRVFWVKMGLLVLLLANGGLMTRIEARMHAGTGDAERTWRSLRPVAVASLVLWLALTLAGVALTSAA